ncbi:glycosyltransferase [Novosphingobium sp. FSY-8]|uniref:Glycosyltransferase n=1 Tax=Novosphingobium ovatum TaxID=1908523 RepID=A0ABW9XI40_9SPHN|nr:glycosyltransferase [Novosphingobium ovatum]NBC38057.1 glycosyltransferase [Novosphingobium ovatum]
MRVLSLSTLFPAPPRPAFGKFVANQMGAVARNGNTDLVMINPIGLPPWPLRTRAPYAALATCPATSDCGGITVYHPRFTLFPLIGGDSNPARIARAVLPLVRRLHAEKPFDLIDAQFFFPDGPAAAIIARALGLPLTIKARGSDIHYWGTRPAALRQIRAAADQAATVLPCSAALGRDMAALGIDPDKIRPHYTGLDRALFRPTPRADARAAIADLLPALPAPAPLLVCPGALITIKGQALAISALADIPAAHLALAGVGPEEAALRALAAASGLVDRVHFLGQVSHNRLPVLMSAADAVVLPSEREGLANVWVEALACGTPLVIPNVGGAAEVVTTPAAGHLAERTPQAIAQALNALLAAPPAPEDVAATVAHFSWEANAARLIAVWQQAAR